jgi:hypothetical protein
MSRRLLIFERSQDLTEDVAKLQKLLQTTEIYIE